MLSLLYVFYTFLNNESYCNYKLSEACSDTISAHSVRSPVITGFSVIVTLPPALITIEPVLGSTKAPVSRVTS